MPYPAPSAMRADRIAPESAQEITPHNPAVQLRVLINRNLSAGSLFAFELGFALYGGVFALPQFLQADPGRLDGPRARSIRCEAGRLRSGEWDGGQSGGRDDLHRYLPYHSLCLSRRAAAASAVPARPEPGW